MMIRFTPILLVLALPVHSAEWEQTLATTASLRTAGARLVSSDVFSFEESQAALITYWETATTNRDVYRCVDIVNMEFEPVRQTCWKVLAPIGRRPSEVG